jgi:hypothetical protein
MRSSALRIVQLRGNYSAYLRIVGVPLVVPLCCGSLSGPSWCPLPTHSVLSLGSFHTPHPPPPPGPPASFCVVCCIVGVQFAQKLATDAIATARACFLLGPFRDTMQCGPRHLYGRRANQQRSKRNKLRGPYSASEPTERPQLVDEI